MSFQEFDAPNLSKATMNRIAFGGWNKERNGRSLATQKACKLPMVSSSRGDKCDAVDIDGGRKRTKSDSMKWCMVHSVL
jgi:hypothetical protein